jgi:hypothetical protein
MARAPKKQPVKVEFLWPYLAPTFTDVTWTFSLRFSNFVGRGSWKNLTDEELNDIDDMYLMGGEL